MNDRQLYRIFMGGYTIAFVAIFTWATCWKLTQPETVPGYWSATSLMLAVLALMWGPHFYSRRKKK